MLYSKQQEFLLLFLFKIMGRKIKLIWDFFGEDGLKTAEHHAIHLKEFCEKEEIETFGIGTDVEQGKLVSAFLIVDEEKMIPVRDALRPKRGQWVEEV